MEQEVEMGWKVEMKWKVETGQVSLLEMCLAMGEYFTLPHLFRSDSGQSDWNFQNPWNSVNFFLHIFYTILNNSGRNNY